MTENTPTQNTPLASIRAHRRQTARGITLPLVSGLIVLTAAVAASVGVLVWAGRFGQLSIVKDVLVVLCLLLPMAVCLLPVYLLFMIAAFGTGALHKASARQLRRVNRLSQTITDKTVQVTEVVNKRTLEARVQLAGAEAFMERAFNPRQSDVEQQEQEHDGTTGSS